MHTARSVWQYKPATQKAFALLVATAIAARVGHEGWGLVQNLMADSAQFAAFARALLAGAATGLGALGLLLIRQIDERGMAQFMAVAAGAMAMAALFALFFPALDAAAGIATPFGMGWVVVASVAGYLAMSAVDRAVPHEHPVPQDRSSAAARTVWLMVAAIALHNLPEGFAVGATVGSAGADAAALAIAVQNIPEGLIVATALWSIGIGKPQAALAALGTGMMEPLGALAGIAVAGSSPLAAPLAMGAAAGAMLFVVANEMLRESVRLAPMRRVAPLFAGGFATMTVASSLFS